MKLNFLILKTNTERSTLPHFQKPVMIVLLIFSIKVSFAQQNNSSFTWPKGNKVAISLTFDDARMSQVDTGTALLINKHTIISKDLIIDVGIYFKTSDFSLIALVFTSSSFLLL